MQSGVSTTLLPPVTRPGRFWTGLFRLADPKVSLASFAALFLGGCAAWATDTFSPGWYALTVLGIFCLEVGKNASGEIFDFDSGVDAAVTAADGVRFA